MSSAILTRLNQHPQWSSVRRVIERLEEQGFQAVLAGGCVRDALLGRTLHDFDVATDARPDQVERVFARTVGVGRDFGVMIVVEGGVSVEVATFRRDGPYRDGRHPEHVLFANLKEDASRRDFTINALFFDLKSQSVIDEVGGVKDLKSQLIRAVGQPDQRFKEDKLRVIRAIRFAAQLNFEIEAETWRAICRSYGQVVQVASERQIEELRKLSDSPYASYGWELMFRSKLLEVVLPELNELVDQQTRLWQRSLFFLKAAPMAIPLPFVLSWFAMVLTDGAVDVRRWLGRLKASSIELERAQKLTRLMPLLRSEKVQTGRKLSEVDGEDAVWIFLLWQGFLEVRQEKDWGQFNKCLELYSSRMGPDGRLPSPILKGEDLLSVGVEPGPMMGKILAESYWLQIEKNLSRTELLGLISKEKLKN